jgi:hypothetical protein
MTWKLLPAFIFRHMVEIKDIAIVACISSPSWLCVGDNTGPLLKTKDRTGANVHRQLASRRLTASYHLFIQTLRC